MQIYIKKNTTTHAKLKIEKKWGCKISWYGEKIWLKYQQLCVVRDIQYIFSIILKVWTRCLIGLMIPPTCPSHSPCMFNLVWKNQTFISCFSPSSLESWFKLKAFVLSVQSSISTIVEGRILWLKLWKLNSKDFCIFEKIFSSRLFHKKYPLNIKKAHSLKILFVWCCKTKK